MSYHLVLFVPSRSTETGGRHQAVGEIIRQLNYHLDRSEIGNYSFFFLNNILLSKSSLLIYPLSFNF